jgi:hypothetical protein
MMPRRTPAQYEPPPINLDYLPFDEEALRRILLEARVPVASDPALLVSASGRLNPAAQMLRMQQGLATAPTDAGSRKALARRQRLASQLRAELPVTHDESLFGADDSLGDNPRVADGITRLLVPTMTRLMQERVAQGKDARGNGAEVEEIFGADNAADAFLVLTELLDLLVAASAIELERRKGATSVKTASPLKDFVRTARKVYSSLTDDPAPSMSRHSESGTLQGTLIPFLEGCCRHLGETTKRETLAGWVREIREEAETSAPPV